jgi:hypothetical protein
MSSSQFSSALAAHTIHAIDVAAATEDRVGRSSRASLSTPGSNDKGVQCIQRRATMKRKLLLVFSAAMLGLQSGFLQASPYPADAEASYDLAAAETYADRVARLGESPDVWGVSRRVVQPHDPFPFGGGFIDD